MKTPTMLCTLITMMADGHSLVVILPPYLQYKVTAKVENSLRENNKSRETSIDIQLDGQWHFRVFSIELPNSVLSLHTEQEGGGEVHHVVYTDPVILRQCGVEVS